MPLPSFTKDWSSGVARNIVIAQDGASDWTSMGRRIIAGVKNALVSTTSGLTRRWTMWQSCGYSGGSWQCGAGGDGVDRLPTYAEWAYNENEGNDHAWCVLEIAVDGKPSMQMCIDNSHLYENGSNPQAPVYISPGGKYPTAATALTALHAAAATQVAPLVYTEADLDADWVAALGKAASPDTRRKLTFTTGGTTPGNAPASVTIDDGITSETLTLSQVAGTDTTSGRFRGSPLTITFGAATNTDATVSIGVGADVNGRGVVGTTSMRPKAPDEFVMAAIVGSYWAKNDNNAVYYAGAILDLWIAPDGSITRWATFQAGLLTNVASIETLAGPRSDWTAEGNKVVAWRMGHYGYGWPGLGWLLPSAPTTRINRATRSAWTSYEAMWNTPDNQLHPVTVSQRHTDGTDWPTVEYGCWTNDAPDVPFVAGNAGKLGKYVDSWLAPMPYGLAAPFISGDTAPADASRHFICLDGVLIWPWDVAAAPGAGELPATSV